MRFLVFAGSNYYPCGGWSDFIGDSDTVEEAKDLAEQAIAVGDPSMSTSTKCREHQVYLVNIPSRLCWAQVADTLTYELFELSAPFGYCPQCTTEPVFPQWSAQVSPGTEPGNSGTDPLTREQ